MTVVQLWANNQILTSSSVDAEKILDKKLLGETILYNCSAVVEDGVASGNCTEVGIIKYIMTLGIDAQRTLNTKSDHLLSLIPFNSKRKRATTVIQHPDDAQKVRVFCKGAPEIVIDYCTKYANEAGEETEITAEKKTEIIDQIVVESFAKKAFRTLLVAYCDYTIEEFNQLKADNNDFAAEKDREVLEKDLTIVSVFALEDPLRDEIVEAIKSCHAAGITVRMVTGDNINTAKAIAVRAGIISAAELEEEDVCMEGQHFRARCEDLKTLTDESGKTREVVGNKKEFRDVKAKLKVLARSTPEDKYMLVTGLRDEGSVVAVTGDGTNDAPALKRADVGFSMGITGTEVAREASEIVLLDDNFKSIVTAVKWGRNIYNNVRKFLQFQLTVNVVAMFIVFSGGVLFGDAPLTSVQMLWVNLIMDTFAALALATEPPHDSILFGKPYKRNEDIVTSVMWRNIFGQGLYQIIILITLLVWGQELLGITEYNGVACNWQEDLFFVQNLAGELEGTCKTVHYTMIFNTFVFMTVFNEINSRKLGEREFNVFAGFFNNFLFLGIIILTIIVQITLITYGGVPMRCVPLTSDQHIFCLTVGAISLINGVIIKFIPARWFVFMVYKHSETDEQIIRTGPVNTFRKSLTLSKKRAVEAAAH